MNENHRIIVEGKDDKFFITALQKINKIPKSIKVEPYDCRDSLIASLHMELSSSEIQRLAIVMDANSNLAASWQAIANKLTQAGYSGIPNQPSKEGTIIVSTNTESRLVPIVGIWLMPDNQSPGMLEDFMLAMIGKEDSLLPYARQCVDNLPEEQPRFKSTYLSKAIIHTWLAWQEEPGSPMGSAIIKRYLDSECTQAQILTGWLQRLFVDEFPQALILA